jgi:phospholipid N-methyltransferase
VSGNQTVADARRGVVRSINRILGPRAVFLWGFFDEPGAVAAMLPSSQGLVRAMLEPVDWERCKLFVEYGPGVGTFSREIPRRLAPDAHYIAIDTSERFVRYLEDTIDDPRFTAALGSAEDVQQILRAHGHDRADVILSGLPLSSIPREVADAILDATYRSLSDGGSFLTYQYRRAAYEMTRRRFERTVTKVTYRNIPPCILAWGYKEPA